MTRKQLAALWRDRRAAAKRLRYAKAESADDGMFPLSDTRLAMAATELRRAQDRYDKIQAAWVVAGRPDNTGRTRAPPPGDAGHNEGEG